MRIPRTSTIAKAQATIAEGRIVAFPTGTSYGLAVDALQGHALQRLRNLKQRPNEKTFTVCVSTKHWNTYLKLTDAERDFLKRMDNAAVTLLVRPQESLEHLAQNEYIGLRVIDHPLMKELVDALDIPITATSANISGGTPCYTPDCIQQTFPGEYDNYTYDLSLGCILDGGELPENKPSTVVKIVNDRIEVIRPGAQEIDTAG